ncbi:hypothetical protein HY404_01370 [Candidatus Microgenomates bacterium]|nr:hypothetical protein [Candidatus Microgenomates bacterium]
MKLLAHLFIPHRANNYKAKIITPSGCLVILLLFILAQLVINSLAKTSLVLGVSSDLSPGKVIEETNRERLQNGLPTLEINEKLMAGARKKGEDMLSYDYWAHFSPTGTTPWSFFLSNGYQYRYAGENLARDFNSAHDAVAAWMASPSHRENLLSSRYHDIGVAIVQGDLGGKQTTIVVQFLGSTPEFAVLNGGEPMVTSQLASGQSHPATLASTSFDLRRNLSLGIMGLLILVLLVDLVVLAHLRLVRISGRTLAHLSFLSALGLLILNLKQGAIL